MRLLLILLVLLLPSSAFGLSVIPGENENLYGMTTTAGAGSSRGQALMFVL
jgi:preprotein translocase subunit SecG